MNSSSLQLFCNICYEQKDNCWMCRDCQKPICKECVEFKNLETCKVHKKPKTFYCDKCDELQCEVCAVMNDNGHLQTKINEGIYHETEGLLEQCIKELEELKPKFDNKNSEIERKINNYAEKKTEDLNKLIINEKKLVKQKVKEHANSQSNQLQASIYQLKDIEENLTKMINGDGRYSKDALSQIEEFEKTYAKIKEQESKFDQFTNKKNVENYLNTYVLSSLIPPVIEIKDLAFTKSEDKDKQDQFYSSFIHCDKKWRLYLTKSGSNYNFWFSIEGLRKSEVSVKIFVEVVHPTNPAKNVSGYQNFNIVKVDDKLPFERLNLNLRASQIAEYSHGNLPENIILKMNFRFQYDFFTSFINDIDN